MGFQRNTAYRGVGPVVVRFDMVEIGGRLERLVSPVELFEPTIFSKMLIKYKKGCCEQATYE